MNPWLAWAIYVLTAGTLALAAFAVLFTVLTIPVYLYERLRRARSR